MVTPYSKGGLRSLATSAHGLFVFVLYRIEGLIHITQRLGDSLEIPGDSVGIPYSGLFLTVA